VSETDVRSGNTTMLANNVVHRFGDRYFRPDLSCTERANLDVCSCREEDYHQSTTEAPDPCRRWPQRVTLGTRPDNFRIAFATQLLSCHTINLASVHLLRQ